MVTTANGRDAFMEWYTPLHGRFLRYCDSRTLGLETAEDLVQDAILSALENWNKIRDKDRLLAYMVGVINHRMKNRLRSERVRRRYLAERERIVADRLDENPEATVDLQFLLRGLDELPTKQREALELTSIAGFSVREAAAIQGCKEGTLKTRVSRARAQLRTLFAEEGKHMSVAQRLRIYTSILL